MDRETSPLPELPAFQLSVEVAKQVGVAWGTSISQHWRESLESVCRFTIMGLRADAKYRKDGYLRSPPEAEGIRKRQVRIGQTAKKLRDLLAEDLSPPSFYDLSAALQKRFGEQGTEILPDLVVHLTVLSKVARDCGRGGSVGRPKSNDGWDYLIEKVAQCYQKWTGRPARATWSKSSSQNDGPFLRGLVFLHDALPEDVRARSTSFLRSRAADRLKAVRGGKLSPQPSRAHSKSRRADKKPQTRDKGKSPKTR